jgi:osmotically inducible lipoprotein OsmB
VWFLALFQSIKETFMTLRTLSSIIAAAALALGLSACETLDRQQVGTATGAAVGGVAGNVVTGGSTLGTIGGAAAGGVVGHEMTKPR